MPVLEAGEVVADHWEHAGDEDHLPAGQNFIVCLDRLKRDADTLFASGAPVGVVLTPGSKVTDLVDYLDRLALVVIEFPKFRDGRGFTQARVLRERYGFEGEIRATGHVIADQYTLLLRCGFSSVEVPENADVSVWQAALGRYKVAYQPGLTVESPLGWLRRSV